MHRFDFVGGQLLVKDLLQCICICWRIMPHQPKPFAHLAPHELLVRDLVVASIFDDEIENLVKVNIHVSHLGLWVEGGAALLVELAQVLDELFILGSSVDSVLDGWFWRRHFGCIELRHCAGDKLCKDAVGKNSELG